MRPRTPTFWTGYHSVTRFSQ